MKLELKDMKHVYPTGDEALKGIDLVIECSRTRMTSCSWTV